MNNCMKLTVGCLVSTLVIAAATPMMAHAGTLTIYNKNCTTMVGIWNKKRVTVHVYSNPPPTGCTNTKVTIHQGHYKNVELALTGDDGENCSDYGHEAIGTAFGKFDAPADKGAVVTCRKDWLGVCQCSKNLELPR